MTTETVTITHTSEGIRVAWPDATSSVFSNPVYLAEAYAQAIRSKERARLAIIEDVAEKLNRLKALLADEGAPEAELGEMRESLMAVVKILT